MSALQKGGIPNADLGERGDMHPTDAAAAYAALYAPTAAKLLRQVPDVADGLHARLCTLATSPTPEQADQLVRDAAGLTTLMMKVGAALRREAGA